MKKYGIIDWTKESPEVREEIIEFLNELNSNKEFWKRRKELREERSKENLKKRIPEISASPDRCSLCGEEYPRTPEFWNKGAYTEDGLTRRCKFCLREVQAKLRRRKKKNGGREVNRMERRILQGW